MPHPTQMSIASEKDCEECMKHFNGMQADIFAGMGANPQDADELAPSDLFKCRDSTAQRHSKKGRKLEESPTTDDLPQEAEQRGALRHQRRNVRRKSQTLWSWREHTVLVLDWDDTIFPTTWIREDCGLDWKLPVGEQVAEDTERGHVIKRMLQLHEQKAQDFLTKASSMANVFIVTLAKPAWVETSIANFMEGLGPVLELSNIKVTYAQEYLTPDEKCQAKKQAFTCYEEWAAFWTRVKREAIAKELEKFHNNNGTSWKNILSFGDSVFEVDGMIAAGQDYMKQEIRHGREIVSGGVECDQHSQGTRKLRIKTVKMIAQPTVEELMAQLTLMTRWLNPLVCKDGNMRLELADSENDDLLSELNAQVTGEFTKISWNDECPYL